MIEMTMLTPLIPVMTQGSCARMASQLAPELTVVIPTFKERNNVAQMVGRLRKSSPIVIGKSFL